MGLKFYNMGKKPLEYNVYCNKKVVIPAGTTGVKIAFRQSHMWRFDKATGKYVKMNVYLWKGHCYHQ